MTGWVHVTLARPWVAPDGRRYARGERAVPAEPVDRVPTGTLVHGPSGQHDPLEPDPARLPGGGLTGFVRPEKKPMVVVPKLTGPHHRGGDFAPQRSKGG